MEVLIVLCVLLAIVAVAISQSRHEDRSPPQQTHEASQQFVQQSFCGSRTAKRAQSFDTQSSHTVSPKRVIEGPAYVTDGDTITIQNTQIRLYGIDAPELNHPYSNTAKWAMVRLCKGHKIRAEVTEENDYGRTVAKCFLPDGRDLSAEMVEQGLALDWAKFSGGRYRHLEVAGVRKKLWLADARQKGRMQVWEKFEARHTDGRA